MASGTTSLFSIGVIHLQIPGLHNSSQIFAVDTIATQSFSLSSVKPSLRWAQEVVLLWCGLKGRSSMFCGVICNGKTQLLWNIRKDREEANCGITALREADESQRWDLVSQPCIRRLYFSHCIGNEYTTWNYHSLGRCKSIGDKWLQSCGH